jgi:hypothetical protein
MSCKELREYLRSDELSAADRGICDGVKSDRP